jgi:hypothetical protein
MKYSFGETSIRRKGIGEMGFGEIDFGETYRNQKNVGNVLIENPCFAY